MSKDLMNKIENFVDTTQSEQDRLGVSQISHDLLCNYLMSHLRKVTEKNKLKTLIEKKFMEMIENVDNLNDPLPLPAILKIYEILAKSETDADAAILGLFQKNQNLFVNLTHPNIEDLKRDQSLTPEEMNEAVKIYNTFKKLEKSEGSDNIEEE